MSDTVKMGEEKLLLESYVTTSWKEAGEASVDNIDHDVQNFGFDGT